MTQSEHMSIVNQSWTAIGEDNNYPLGSQTLVLCPPPAQGQGYVCGRLHFRPLCPISSGSSRENIRSYKRGQWQPVDLSPHGKAKLTFQNRNSEQVRGETVGVEIILT